MYTNIIHYIDTKRFSTYEANKSIIQAKRHGTFRNLWSKSALKIMPKSSVLVPMLPTTTQEFSDTRPVIVIVGPYLGLNKEFQNLGRNL